MRLLVSAWLELIDALFQDLVNFDKREQLLKAKVLNQFIQRDLTLLAKIFVCDHTKLPQRRRDDLISPPFSDSTIKDYTEDDDHKDDDHQNHALGQTSLVWNLLPIKVPPGSNLESTILKGLTSQERDAMKAKYDILREKCREDKPPLSFIVERWKRFVSSMEVFDMANRFIFDLSQTALMSDQTLRLWQSLMSSYLSNEDSSLEASPVSKLLGVSVVNNSGGDAAAEKPHNRVHVASGKRYMPKSGVSRGPRHRRRTTGSPGSLKRRHRLRRSLSRIRLLGHSKSNHEVVTQQSQTKNLESLILDEDESTGWTTETKKGIKIQYKVDAEGKLIARVTSNLECDLLSLLAALSDVSSWKTWIPYVSSSEKLATFSNASFLCSVISDLPWPIKQRETIGVGTGVDALDEVGAIILCLSVPSDIDETCTAHKVFGFEVPSPNPRIPRLPENTIAFFLFPVSESVTSVEISARVNPGVSFRIVRSIIIWVLKQTIGLFFTKLEKMGLEKVETSSLTPDKEFNEYVKGRLADYLRRHNHVNEKEQLANRYGEICDSILVDDH